MLVAVSSKLLKSKRSLDQSHQSHKSQQSQQSHQSHQSQSSVIFPNTTDAIFKNLVFCRNNEIQKMQSFIGIGLNSIFALLFT